MSNYYMYIKTLSDYIVIVVHLYIKEKRMVKANLCLKDMINQRTNGPVNAHLLSWPGKAQNIQNLENIL